jgi:hypothetical protein
MELRRALMVASLLIGWAAFPGSGPSAQERGFAPGPVPNPSFEPGPRLDFGAPPPGPLEADPRPGFERGFGPGLNRDARPGFERDFGPTFERNPAPGVDPNLGPNVDRGFGFEAGRGFEPGGLR